MSDWIEHDGLGMPVDGATTVCVRLRDGRDYSAGPANEWGIPAEGEGWEEASNWVWFPEVDEEERWAEIIAYKIVP